MTIQKAILAIKNEMKPSMGCTEPVAIGLAVSRTCEMLSKPLKKIEMVISSNIFKNAYSVQIPNTGTYGIELSCALGALLSKEGNTMEIFADISPAHVERAKEMVEDGIIDVDVLSSSQFYIQCTVFGETETATTITQDSHDNMVFAKKNDTVIFEQQNLQAAEKAKESFEISDYQFSDFLSWAENVDPSELQFIKDGIEMNLEIAKRGLEKKYALGIGSTLDKLTKQNVLSNDLVTDVKRTIAAACDFRMSGGNGSVMTYLGSGNQGIESMLPVAVVAKNLKVSEEKMLRASFFAMLVTMFLKKHVGRLSPICGATLAGAGSSAGMVYLMDGDLKQMKGAVQNMMAGVAGMFCDGAKGGCALKLSICAGEAVYSALYAMDNSMAEATDGIISTEVEETVKNIAKLSHEGLADVDMKVIEIMQTKA